MSTIDLMQIRNELCHTLRYSDVLSTSVRNVTRVTEGYTVGITGETTHTFAHNPIRDFKLVTVDGTNKYYLRDYDVAWGTGVLTWNTPLVSGNVVSAQYDYGASDKIYPDLPRDDITMTSFPRVGIEMTSLSTTPLGLGGLNHITDILMTVIVWAPVNKDTNVASGYGGLTDLEGTMGNIRSVMRAQAKNFSTFSWATPQNTSPLIRGEANKIMQKSQDFLIRFKVE